MWSRISVGSRKKGEEVGSGFWKTGEVDGILGRVLSWRKCGLQSPRRYESDLVLLLVEDGKPSRFLSSCS